MKAGDGHVKCPHCGCGVLTAFTRVDAEVRIYYGLDQVEVDVDTDLEWSGEEYCACYGCDFEAPLHKFMTTEAA